MKGLNYLLMLLYFVLEPNMKEAFYNMLRRAKMLCSLILHALGSTLIFMDIRCQERLVSC